MFVLIEVLRKLRVVDYVSNPTDDDIPPIVVSVCTHLPQCIDLLTRESGLSPIILPIETLDPPLGVLRYAVVELLESTVLTNTSYVFDEFSKTNVMTVLLDLFFRYRWNNFLHQSVHNILATTIQSGHVGINTSIFKEGAFISRVLNADKEEAENAEKRKGMTSGYMAHLTKLTTFILDYVDSVQMLKESIEDPQIAQQWNDYLTKSYALRYKRECVKLGSKMPVSIEEPTLEKRANDESADIELSQNGGENDVDFFAGVSESEPTNAASGTSISFFENGINNKVIEGGVEMTFFESDDNGSSMNFFDIQPQKTTNVVDDTNIGKNDISVENNKKQDDFFAADNTDFFAQPQPTQVDATVAPEVKPDDFFAAGGMDFFASTGGQEQDVKNDTQEDFFSNSNANVDNNNKEKEEEDDDNKMDVEEDDKEN